MSKAVPTAQELAAIVAAVELLWPRPAVLAPPPEGSATPAWRFSGRWWAAPPSGHRSDRRYHPGVQQGRPVPSGGRSVT